MEKVEGGYTLREFGTNHTKIVPRFDLAIKVLREYFGEHE
jgi:hypothetical protein